GHVKAADAGVPRGTADIVAPRNHRRAGTSRRRPTGPSLQGHRPTCGLPPPGPNIANKTTPRREHPRRGAITRVPANSEWTPHRGVSTGAPLQAAGLNRARQVRHHERLAVRGPQHGIRLVVADEGLRGTIELEFSAEPERD